MCNMLWTPLSPSPHQSIFRSGMDWPETAALSVSTHFVSVIICQFDPLEFWVHLTKTPFDIFWVMTWPACNLGGPELSAQRRGKWLSMERTEFCISSTYQCSNLCTLCSKTLKLVQQISSFLIITSGEITKCSVLFLTDKLWLTMTLDYICHVLRRYRIIRTKSSKF